MHGWRILVAVCLAGVVACTGTRVYPEDAKKDGASVDYGKSATPVVDEKTKQEPELGFKAARIRLEAFAATGTQSGHREREGDFHGRVAIDYEIPVIRHMTVAPRLIPFMYLHESGFGEGELSAYGFGVALRGYQNGIEQRGFFGELNANVIGETSHFSGNSGTFNFLEELGVGYMFKSHWHVTAKISHISNASLADHNSGLNAAGLGVGYSFKPHRKR